MRSPEPGVFLVASPALTDANFARTVVFLVAHGDEGSLGFVINRPLETTLGTLWMDCPPALREARIAGEGGPVDTEKGLFVHRVQALPEAAHLGGGLWAGGEITAIVHRWLTGPDPQGPRLFLGHSGWSPGQLAKELEQGAWIVRPGQLDLLFTGAVDEGLWRRLARPGFPGGTPSAN